MSNALSQSVMDDVKLLLSELTIPEAPVRFDPPARATPVTIQNGINPPIVTWTWPGQAARLAQTLTQDDVGKYGLQTDSSALYKLASFVPVIWEFVVTQTDTTTSSPFELSTGASDATSYHDFFRLQLAFEDVWVELLDAGVQKTGEQLYALWDARMDPTLDDTGTTDRLKRFATAFIYFSNNPSVGATVTLNGVTFTFSDNPTAATDVQLGDTLVDSVVSFSVALTASTEPDITDHWAYAVNDSDASRIEIMPRDNSSPGIRFTTSDNANIHFNDYSNIEISGADELQHFIDFLKSQYGITSSGVSNAPSPASPLSAQMANVLADILAPLSQAHWGPFDIVDGYQLVNGGTQTPVGMLSAIAQGLGYKIAFDPDPNNKGKMVINNPDGTLFNGTPVDFLNFIAAREHQEVLNLRLAAAGTSPVGASDSSFLDINTLLKSLDSMLKEKYRFDIFAPASINYGLLLNYRQRWQPQSYQVGNLVSTIPLAPQEVRRYTTKTVIKKSRNVKEMNDSLRSGKDDSSETSRVDAEIVQRAKNQSNFQMNASGSYGNDELYKVSAGIQQGQDQAVESAQTKREFHESVVKSAQEYRNQNRMEISTEESREDESTSSREIRNPNDELTVTYLFYELQRRYLVDERLHKVTPVIFVANDVPAPHEVDPSWLSRHDWIIRRTILDDSFLPALEYLSTNYTGAEVSLKVLGLSVEDQRAVVAKITGQVQLASDALNAATTGLVGAENQQVSDMHEQEQVSLVKSFFDPLGITKTGTDGNADRAAVDYAKDALQRAQAKVAELKSQLKAEMTALQVAIDKYTRAATEHFSKLADIDRLRIHIKDNIIYYMQAIWTYEPADQRYFRLYNVDVPVFTHNTTVTVSPAGGLALLDTSHDTFRVRLATPTIGQNPDGTTKRMKLHQIADIDNLIGFKGNYMIFPMVNFNYMQWFMMQDYLTVNGDGVWAVDPDPLAGLTIDKLKTTMQNFYNDNKKTPDKFAAVEPTFRELLTRLLSDNGPEIVIVPSKSLYIEALPGTHPLLEDFKLIHRAIDVKKVQAEARHAELENLRLAARLSKGELGDPDIDKVVVVGSGQNVTVDAGQ